MIKKESMRYFDLRGIRTVELQYRLSRNPSSPSLIDALHALIDQVKSRMTSLARALLQKMGREKEGQGADGSSQRSL